jgi:hypothetical protein
MPRMVFVAADSADSGDRAPGQVERRELRATDLTNERR